MTRVPHPALRRLSASGATASRLRATLERVERELGGVTFGLDRLRLLDDAVLEPLTRRVGVTESLTRARSAPTSEADARANDAGNDAGVRALRPRRADHPTAEESARLEDDRATRRIGHAVSASARDADARYERAARRPSDTSGAQPAKHGGAHEQPQPIDRGAPPVPRFAQIDPGLLHDARMAVARRLDAGSALGTGTPASDAGAARGSQTRSELTRHRPHAAGNAAQPDAVAATTRMATPHASAPFTVAPLRIGAVPVAVAAMLERAAPDAQFATSSGRNAPSHGERDKGNLAPPGVSNRSLDSLLERAADRASSRVRGARAPLAPQSRDGQPSDSRTVQDISEAALDAASGLRRLVARAGVTPMSAARPAQAGVERAEGTMGVVSDRLEENALAQRLGRLLRREARREGIDLDEAGA